MSLFLRLAHKWKARKSESRRCMEDGGEEEQTLILRCSSGCKSFASLSRAEGERERQCNWESYSGDVANHTVIKQPCTWIQLETYFYSLQRTLWKFAILVAGVVCGGADWHNKGNKKGWTRGSNISPSSRRGHGLAQLEPKAEHITGVQEQEQGQAEVKLFASQQPVEVSMKFHGSFYSIQRRFRAYLESGMKLNIFLNWWVHLKLGCRSSFINNLQFGYQRSFTSINFVRQVSQF